MGFGVRSDGSQLDPLKVVTVASSCSARSPLSLLRLAVRWDGLASSNFSSRRSDSRSPKEAGDCV